MATLLIWPDFCGLLVTGLMRSHCVWKNWKHIHVFLSVSMSWQNQYTSGSIRSKSGLQYPVDSIIQASDNGGLMGAMTTGPMAFNKLSYLSLNTCSAQHSVLFEIWHNDHQWFMTINQNYNVHLYIFVLQCSYINGSPQNTNVPGVVELAKKHGTFIGGDDFKSGQTKMKSVLVDFLVSAGLKVCDLKYNKVS